MGSNDNKYKSDDLTPPPTPKKEKVKLYILYSHPPSKFKFYNMTKRKTN